MWSLFYLGLTILFMLDGRIDVQGTTEGLRKQGLLEGIKQDCRLSNLRPVKINLKRLRMLKEQKT